MSRLYPFHLLKITVFVSVSDTDSSRRKDDGARQVTSRNAADLDSIKRSSVSWLLATTLRMCKTDPTSCFRSRVTRFAANERPEPGPASASASKVGLQQQLIMSSLAE